MRKLLALASISVLTLTLAVPGLAAKPDKTPPGQEPPAGLTCADWEFDDPTLWTVGSASDDFSVKLDVDEGSPETQVACFDVSSAEGDWIIDIVEAVDVAGLQVHIKDSQPGDFCFREGYGGKKNPIPSPIEPIVVTDVPAADIDACTPGEVGLAADGHEDLVFMVAFTPERGASTPSVTIEVDLPPTNDGP